MDSAGQTDVGRVREHNEDSYLVDQPRGLFVVADGMGGHSGGRMASSLAVDAISRFVLEHEDEIQEGLSHEVLETSPIPRILANAVRAASLRIFKCAQEEPDLHGMGTTVTTLLVGEGRAYIAHVGDSRTYFQRGERVVQVTDDHSLVNEQIKAGLITKEQARTSRLKNIITRSVGFERDVAVDTFAMPLEHGDRFLLCSDGLANFVDDTEIGLALNTMALDAVPGAMIDLANDRGGDDNITVVTVAVHN